MIAHLLRASGGTETVRIMRQVYLASSSLTQRLRAVKVINVKVILFLVEQVLHG